MLMDINCTCCDDHLAIRTSIKSGRLTPEVNIMPFVNYTSIIKRGEDRDGRGRDFTLNGLLPLFGSSDSTRATFHT